MIFDTESAVGLLYLSNTGSCLKTEEFVIITNAFLWRKNILDMIEFTSKINKRYMIFVAKGINFFELLFVVASYFFL
ncbi:MAG: hypothetical protein Q3M30_08240 [Candidatus Electrothrix sp. Rat3]|nr:hypothetical protein [Candidatus Electrothrix rattekaaiensis]